MSDYIDFTTAAKSLPNRPHAATVWRWARRGVLVRGAGQRVRLQCVRLGGSLFTTPAWLEQFARALAEADRAHFDANPATPEPASLGRSRTPEQRQQAAAAARCRIAGATATGAA